MGASDCPLCNAPNSKCDCPKKLPKSYWKARALVAENKNGQTRNEEFEAKLALIDLFEKLAPTKRAIPSAAYPTQKLANDIYRMVKDHEDKLEQEAYEDGVSDVCEWLRENPPIDSSDLETIANQIEERYGLNG